MGRHLGPPRRPRVDGTGSPRRRGGDRPHRQDGSCAFLTADNLCRINPVKPDKCRTFPQSWINPDSASVCPALAETKALLASHSATT
ncbi:MAG: YkgJ family cysteine cluster protein [Kiritimatiellae bacterium]|nr:YkgJ family cysteine cluster protein [Kiritimatiellia bacterium]